MYCYICNELIPEDEISHNLKCVYIRNKMKKMNVNEIYKMFIQYYSNQRLRDLKIED